MTKRPEPNRHVMLNLFQHLVCFFLLSADTPFIPVHRTGFSGAILIKIPNPNVQITKTSYRLGFWSLEIIWNLVFGIWNFFRH
jgi:hypothetical protein